MSYLLSLVASIGSNFINANNDDNQHPNNDHITNINNNNNANDSTALTKKRNKRSASFDSTFTVTESDFSSLSSSSTDSIESLTETIINQNECIKQLRYQLDHPNYVDIAYNMGIKASEEIISNKAFTNDPIVLSELSNYDHNDYVSKSEDKCPLFHSFLSGLLKEKDDKLNEKIAYYLHIHFFQF